MTLRALIPSRVGSYKPNRLGIYDMHGNVWEWCAEHSEAGNSGRVARGSGWRGHGIYCRASHRYRFGSSNRYSTLGFRVAAVPSEE